MEIVTHVDEFFLKEKVPMPYPCVVIQSEHIEELGVIMDCLEEGDVSVIFELNGTFNVVNKKISRSALTLQKLLRIYNFVLYADANTRYDVRSIPDLLEWTP